ncbi:MAG: glycosyltransferase family 2 protein [Planctomycetota bacterium]
MELSCLFVNFNSWRLLAGAIASLRASPPLRVDGTAIPYEVIVVDNASTIPDPVGQAAVAELVAATGGVVLRSSGNLGYARGMNLARSRASGRLLLVCNPDIVFGPDAIGELVRHFEASGDVGAVEPAVFADEDFEVHMPVHIVPRPLDLVRLALGSISRRCNRRYSARRTRAALPVWLATGAVEGSMVGGCCFLTSRAVVDRVGFFDPEYPLYYEDTDLSRRLRRAGLRVLRIATARIVHLYDQSARTNRAEAEARLLASRRRYFARWFGWRGRCTLAFTNAVLASRWGRSRMRRVADWDAATVGPVRGAPLLMLPGPCERFVVEVAFEPFLFLAAAAFGSGDSWTPGAAASLRLDREAWLRVVDISAAEPVEIGRWRYSPAEPRRS